MKLIYLVAPLSFSHNAVAKLYEEAQYKTKIVPMETTKSTFLEDLCLVGSFQPSKIYCSHFAQLQNVGKTIQHWRVVLDTN